jgi:nucleoside-diphosphate-sugar epimerase
MQLIARFTHFEGEIRWQPNKPDGQPRRRLEVSRAFEKFGFRAQVPFEEGLRRTIEWYETCRTTASTTKDSDSGMEVLHDSLRP